MIPLVDCAGAPRDLGLDQGRALRAALAVRLAELPRADALALRLGWSDATVRRLRRDLARHFPHLSETVAGLAAGARVPEAFVARETAALLARVEAPAAALAGESPVLALALDGPLVVRRSRPEGLFASLELSRPGLPSALLGVNERGLAVAVAESRAPGPGSAAPAALLAQDCLERFAAVEAALDWCAGRPGGGRAMLLLGDASGEIAGIALEGSGRRVLRPAEGCLARGAAGAELAKALGQARAGALPPPGVARVDCVEPALTVSDAVFRLPAAPPG